MSIRLLTDTDVGPQTKRKIVTLDSNGEATWTFSASFASEPVISWMYREAADSQPIIVKVKSLTQVAGAYTAVTVKGYRAQTLPASILTLAALVLFNVFGGAAPNGATVYLYAALPTE